MNIIPFYGCYLFFFYSLWTLPVAQLKITNGRYKNAYIYYLLHKIEYICIIRDISHAQYILVQFVTSHTLSIYLYNSRHLTHSVYTCTIRDISHTQYILVQFATSHTLIIYLYNSWHLTHSVYNYNSRHLTHSVYTCTIRDISHTQYILVQFATSHTLSISVFNFEF